MYGVFREINRTVDGIARWAYVESIRNYRGRCDYLTIRTHWVQSIQAAAIQISLDQKRKKGHGIGREDNRLPKRPQKNGPGYQKYNQGMESAAKIVKECEDCSTKFRNSAVEMILISMPFDPVVYYLCPLCHRTLAAYGPKGLVGEKNLKDNQYLMRIVRKITLTKRD